MQDTPLPTVLVLGARGRFGAAAVAAFDASGWQVVAQVRHGTMPGLPARARLLAAPLGTDGQPVADALAARGMPAPQVVVHAVNPAYTRWDEEVMPAARAAMALAERLGARFMLPGNIYNYGAGMPPRIEPDTPQRPTTPKGRLRTDLEAELAARAAAGRLRATVITAGDFFGAGRGSWLDLVIVKPIARGRLDYPGDPAVLHTWAYLPDLARAFVAAASAPQPAPFERFMFAGHAVTGDAFLVALQQAAADAGIVPTRAWRRGGLPWGLIRALGPVVPLWRELARMRYLWQVPHALDGSRLAAAVGTLPATPLREALAASLRELEKTPAATAG